MNFLHTNNGTTKTYCGGELLRLKRGGTSKGVMRHDTQKNLLLGVLTPRPSSLLYHTQTRIHNTCTNIAIEQVSDGK